MKLCDQHITSKDFEPRLGNGAVVYGRWFGKTLDANGWSHPKLVKLAQRATNELLVHSSQIGGLRAGLLKSPGPRSFASIVFLFHEIDLYQKGEQHKDSPSFEGLESLIENAVIMRDDDGNPASLGFHYEVFCGWRMPPEMDHRIDYSAAQAELISKNAALYVRRLMIAERMDPISDLIRLKKAFSTDKNLQEEFGNVIWEQTTWDPDDLDHAISCLSNVLLKVFKEQRRPEELTRQFLK